MDQHPSRGHKDSSLLPTCPWVGSQKGLLTCKNPNIASSGLSLEIAVTFATLGSPIFSAASPDRAWGSFGSSTQKPRRSEGAEKSDKIIKSSISGSNKPKASSPGPCPSFHLQMDVFSSFQPQCDLWAGVFWGILNRSCCCAA